MLVFVVGGCDAVFGVRQVTVVPPDAAPTCPALGSQMAPKFGTVAFMLAADCDHYVTSAAASPAMAWCYSGSTTIIKQGRDAILSPAPGVKPVVSTNQVELPRLDPEGDILIVRERQLTGTPTVSFDGFARLVDGGWAYTAKVALPAVGFPDRLHDEISMVAGAAGDRRLIYSNTIDSTFKFYELQDVGGGWKLASPSSIATYSLMDLEPAGVTLLEMHFPNLTPDGLRLVFVGRLPFTLVDELLYTDRANLGARFGPAVAITNAPPGLTDAYLTGDCGHLFYSSYHNNQAFRLEQ